MNRQDRSMPNNDDPASLPDIAGPLATGVRVSLELPQAGTCVASVTSHHETTLVLELLDDVPEGELEPGARLDLFMPRSEGIYHWPCALNALPQGRRAEVRLLSPPMFVQRRLGHRVASSLAAQVRRVHATRRGRPTEMSVADLSHGGLKLEGTYQLSTGDTIEVSLPLPGPLQVVGRVVMAYPTEAGQWALHVSFLEGQAQAAAVIEDYLSGPLKERAASSL